MAGVGVTDGRSAAINEQAQKAVRAFQAGWAKQKATEMLTALEVKKSERDGEYSQPVNWPIQGMILLGIIGGAYLVSRKI